MTSVAAHSYSGESNYAQTLKWRELSQTADGAATIFNLIWTDLAATAVVGTVTGFESSYDHQLLEKRQSDNTNVLGKRTVNLVIHHIAYTVIWYAIPAAILAVIFVVAFAAFLILLCCGQTSLRLLKHYINQTGIGRAVTQHEYQGMAAPDATSHDWHEAVGWRIINVPVLPRKRAHKTSLSRNGVSLHAIPRRPVNSPTAYRTLARDDNHGIDPGDPLF